MSTIHFLNVNDGDCSWIKHESGRVTVIDVCAANEESLNEAEFSNHQQKKHPVNPITYLNDYNVSSIFRFILTHPDMDHMDGIKSLFESFNVVNFWDTANKKVMDENSSWGKYKKDDWDFYQEIRKSCELTVLYNYAGNKGKYYNQDENGKDGSDGLYILAPTEKLVKEANESKEYNDCSYVILYRTHGKKIVFAGDSAEKTWNYILEKHKEDVTNVDILLAPHHGRKTGGNRDYLDTLKPKLTLFGNAKSEYLDYNAWNNRKLEHITNNEANCVIMNIIGNKIDIYVTYETFAKEKNPDTFYAEDFKAWYIMTI